MKIIIANLLSFLFLASKVKATPTFVDLYSDKEVKDVAKGFANALECYAGLRDDGTTVDEELVDDLTLLYDDYLEEYIESAILEIIPILPKPIFGCYYSVVEVAVVLAYLAVLDGCSDAPIKNPTRNLRESNVKLEQDGLSLPEIEGNDHGRNLKKGKHESGSSDDYIIGKKSNKGCQQSADTKEALEKIIKKTIENTPVDPSSGCSKYGINEEASELLEASIGALLEVVAFAIVSSFPPGEEIEVEDLAVLGNAGDWSVCDSIVGNQIP